MPISLLKPGEQATIKAIRGDALVVKHLCDLGLVEGSSVRVISQTNGNLVLEVKGTRLALDKSLAGKIFV